MNIKSCSLSNSDLEFCKPCRHGSCHRAHSRSKDIFEVHCKRDNGFNICRIAAAGLKEHCKVLASVAFAPLFKMHISTQAGLQEQGLTSLYWPYLNV